MTPGQKVFVEAEVRSADGTEVRLTIWDRWRKPHLVVVVPAQVAEEAIEIDQTVAVLPPDVTTGRRP